jgi:hypothetical protein
VATARFKIGEKVYTTGSIDKVTLRDLLTFQADLDELGMGASWSDVETAAEEIGALPDDEAQKHPRALLVFATTIWASRRAAGEAIRFIDAIDFEMGDLTMLPAPADKAAKKADPTRAAKKPQPQQSASEEGADLPDDGAEDPIL